MNEVVDLVVAPHLGEDIVLNNVGDRTGLVTQVLCLLDAYPLVKDLLKNS